MSLGVKQIRYTIHPWLNEPIIDKGLILNADLSEFDYDGYHLTELEKEFYKQNEIELISSNTTYTDLNFLHQYPYKQPWLYKTESSENVFINKSFHITRYAFSGRSNYQLECLHTKVPEVRKLLILKPKWWLILHIDWIDNTGVYEIINFNKSYTNLELLKYDKKVIEQTFLNIDLDSASRILIAQYSDWKDLLLPELNTYKKEYFGISDV